MLNRRRQAIELPSVTRMWPSMKKAAATYHTGLQALPLTLCAERSDLQVSVGFRRSSLFLNLLLEVVSGGIQEGDPETNMSLNVGKSVLCLVDITF